MATNEMQSRRYFEALGTIYTKCCATCKHWERARLKATGEDAFGYCRLTAVPLDAYTSRHAVTLDLSLCSKWEEKEAE